jgi:Angiotensin-converting enzyme
MRARLILCSAVAAYLCGCAKEASAPPAVPGTRRIDAAAITEYFQPLMGWLSEQNKNRQRGWE